jgi:threonine synthase
VVVGDADAARGVAELGAQGLWVELCAGACVGAAAQLCQHGHIAPQDHVLLLLTAKGDRDA